MVQKRQKAKLVRLKNEMGNYVETREDMEEESINYFGTIMKEYWRDRSEHIEKGMRNIPNLVTQAIMTS